MSHNTPVLGACTWCHQAGVEDPEGLVARTANGDWACLECQTFTPEMDFDSGLKIAARRALELAHIHERFGGLVDPVAAHWRQVSAEISKLR